MLKKLLIVFLLTSIFWNCRDDVDQVSSDPGIQLSFSESIVDFDTIFTTVGSVTKRIKIYNTNSEAVTISSVSIGSNSEAFFRINVDGFPGPVVNNITIAGKDSLFVFVDVTIDPKDQNLPFLVEDSIVFLTNGNVQSVRLLARGQDAIFFTPDKFVEGLPPYTIVGQPNQTETWTKTKPIVIYGYAVVDSDHRLEIEAGTQIYFHANSGLWIFQDGQLDVNGTQEEPVVFQGDRLDAYKDVSGSWDRIWINEGKDNTINWAVIKNSFIGIQAEHQPFKGRKDGWNLNTLEINNTIIDNTKLAGIYGINSVVFCENVLVSNSGTANFITAGGGYYQFDYCTLANYWRGEIRNTPTVFLSHLYYDFEAQVYVQDSVNAFFNNCIIYGDQDSEFNIEDEVDPGTRVNYVMNHTLLKTDDDTVKYGTYNNAVINPSNESVFLNPYGSDFHLRAGSPAKDIGDDNFSTITDKDLEGQMRTSPSDAGVYESK